MRDEGEPINRGQRDPRAADRPALRDGLFFVAFVGVVLLVKGILAIPGIEVLQNLGVWPRPEATPTGP